MIELVKGNGKQLGSNWKGTKKKLWIDWEGTGKIIGIEWNEMKLGKY